MTRATCTVCGQDDFPLCHFPGSCVLCTACVALGHWADFGLDEHEAKAVAMGWWVGVTSEDDL